MPDKRAGRTQEQINRGLSKDGEFIGWTAKELGRGEERSMSETAMSVKEIHNWVFTDLGFCGCGDPEMALEFLRSVLDLINSRSENSRASKSHSYYVKASRQLEDMIGMERSPAMVWSYL